jgi:hypothetical protein
MERDDVLTAVIIVGVLSAAVGLALGINWLERASISREARAGQAKLERYLAEHHAGRSG